MTDAIGESDFIPLDDLLARLAECADCREPIYADDDDAGVCIKCGGMNRRWPAYQQETRG